MKYNAKYINELNSSLNGLNLKQLENKNILISGATGLIGSFFVDSILINKDFNVKILCIVRNLNQAIERFYYFKNDSRLIFLECDITNEIFLNHKIDYIIHAASLTDPKNYSIHPVETMTTNILGTKNLLELAYKKKSKFIFLSSCEVYGLTSKRNISESDYGYINYLDPRSCYNEAKIASETLCVSFNKEYGVHVLILRLSRVYGPTMKLTDTKALSQFINNVLDMNDITLKSNGEQLFNYTYVGDVVRALIISMVNKNNRICYNFSSTQLLPLKEIASILAKINNTNVVFSLPSEKEQSGYSKANISSLNSELFENEYGFNANTNFKEGILKTLDILISFK